MDTDVKLKSRQSYLTRYSNDQVLVGERSSRYMSNE